MIDELSTHQKAAIEALVEVKRICDKHSIRFFLLAGSALGAVRHEGMIPWDDDVDVGLLRDDWYRLRNVLPGELNKEFQYCDDEIRKDWPRPYGKITHNGHVCVDLFLLAKWTDNKIAGYEHWLIHKVANKLYLQSIHFNCPLVRRPEWSTLRYIRFKLIRVVGRWVGMVTNQFFSREDFLRLIRWNECFFENTDSQWYINLFSAYSMKKEMLKKEWLMHPATVKYAGEYYLMPGDIDGYLTHLYGDYMTPPPDEKRVQMHSGIFLEDYEKK